MFSIGNVLILQFLVTQANQQIVLLSHTPAAVKKKKRRRSRKAKSDIDTVSTVSSNDHSSNDESSPNRCRRRRNKTRSDTSDLTEEEKSRYIAMDCEMVGVGYRGQRSALARVCLINWNGKKIMDVYVRPCEPVTDYRTFVSGITQDDLEDSHKAIDYEMCRQRVMKHIQDKILVGHALKNDLHALNISHPWYDVRDTGKYEPFMKVRFDDGVLWPRKLKELAKEKLGRDVQRPGVAHSPFEDAKTALDLFKLAHRKWEKAMAYKLSKTLEIQQLQASTEPVAQLAQ
jgi:RNA exonuclease 4